MALFTSLFAGHPLVQLAIGAAFLVVFYFTSHNPNLRSKVLLVPGLLWLLWGVWEWAVIWFSPAANIRVDLLVIMPLVLIASVIAIVLLFRK